MRCGWAAVAERAQQLLRPSGPAFEEAAELFADMPALWARAEPDERRRLINPLVERMYLDIDSKRIGAIKPTPEFRVLIDHALEIAADPMVFLIPPEHADGVNIWRWWRRGRIGLRLTNIGALVVPHPISADWQARVVGWQAAA